jgi:retron-type reverse transcriptase
MLGMGLKNEKNYNAWDYSLLDEDRYFKTIEKWEVKAKANPYLLSSSPTVEGIPLRWILENRDRVVKEIIRSLKSREFEFSEMRAIEMVTDKTRQFYVSHWVDRLVLSVMAGVFVDQTESSLSPHLYSFQRGKGVLDALHDLKNFLQDQNVGKKNQPLYVLKRDVSEYGDSIPHEKLFEKLRAVPGLECSDLYWGLLKSSLKPFIIDDRVPGQRAEYSLRSGVVSGSPLCPVLENFYLSPLDRALGSIPDAFYARYGDDFIFVTDQMDVAEDAALEIENLISEHGVQMKPEKKLNLLFHPGEKKREPRGEFKVATGFEWLGHRIGWNGRLRPKGFRISDAIRAQRAEVDALCRKSKLFESGSPLAIQFINRGLAALAEPGRLNEVERCLGGEMTPGVASELTHQLALDLKNGIQKHWGLSSRAAYGLLARFKLGHWIKIQNRRGAKHQVKRNMKSDQKPLRRSA